MSVGETADAPLRQDCLARGYKRHVYRGEDKDTCVLCGAKRKVNKMGEPCVKCGTVLTEKNCKRIKRHRGKLRWVELRCNTCHALREKLKRLRRRGRGR